MSQHNETNESDASPPRSSEDGNGEGWEWWVRIAILLTVLSALCWGLVYARLGSPSVRIQAFVIPILGWMTLPVVFWGVMRTVFNPPLVRKRRIFGFAILLVVGFFGNVPLFPVPLSTSGWESEHSYRLPFEGNWYTYAGGDALARNYHATNAAYRWGYDFAPRQDGARFAGEGEELKDYYCFGEAALAAAGGEVVRAVDGNKDMPPQEFDQTSVLGNYVAIEVDQNEFLFTAQLKKDSVAVEVGQSVEKGQKLGECGNSGRAVEPHVHVHLQTSARFPMQQGLSLGEPMAEGLPLRFSNYRADGELVERGMPKGQGEGGTPAGQVVEWVGEGD